MYATWPNNVAVTAFQMADIQFRAVRINEKGGCSKALVNQSVVEVRAVVSWRPVGEGGSKVVPYEVGQFMKCRFNYDRIWFGYNPIVPSAGYVGDEFRIV